MEMTDRRVRPEIDGFEVENRYREAISNMPGVRAEVVTVENGPPVGKEIQIELSGDDLDLLFLSHSDPKFYGVRIGRPANRH